MQEKAGISYRTTWRWWKQGNLTGHQLPSGTIIITSEAIEDNLKPDLIACIYARGPKTKIIWLDKPSV